MFHQLVVPNLVPARRGYSMVVGSLLCILVRRQDTLQPPTYVLVVLLQIFERASRNPLLDRRQGMKLAVQYPAEAESPTTHTTRTQAQ